MSKITVNTANTEKIWNWIFQRGGVAFWESVNLSNPGASWFTPAKDDNGQDYGKPSWQAADKPKEIITDPQEVEVSVDKEVKSFHVAVRMSGNGLSMKLTDASSRRVRAAVEKAGKGAYHIFNYGEYKNCVIMKPESKQSLIDWAKEHGKV